MTTCVIVDVCPLGKGDNVLVLWTVSGQKNINVRTFEMDTTD